MVEKHENMSEADVRLFQELNHKISMHMHGEDKKEGEE